MEEKAKIKPSPELRERTTRMVLEHLGEYPSLWAACKAIGAKVGVATATLHNWVKQAQADAGGRDSLSTAERERLKTLEREVKELRRANDILKAASAFFAQAELDRRIKG